MNPHRLFLKLHHLFISNKSLGAFSSTIVSSGLRFCGFLFYKVCCYLFPKDVSFHFSSAFYNTLISDSDYVAISSIDVFAGVVSAYSRPGFIIGKISAPLAQGDVFDYETVQSVIRLRNLKYHYLRVKSLRKPDRNHCDTILPVLRLSIHKEHPLLTKAVFGNIMFIALRDMNC